MNSPSSAQGPIVVAAMNQKDTMSYFSNFGNCVKINAPGEGILSAGTASNTASRYMSGTRYEFS
jgi:subtilisin family serine protease